MGNYEIQACHAKQLFCKRDHAEIAQKLGLENDETFLYVKFLCKPYRIARKTGDISRLESGEWVDANSYREVMVLLDILCDSAPQRFLSGKWKSMGAFGMMFHQNLLEQQRDVWAERFDREQNEFSRACEALGGTKIPGGDITYTFELCDGLCVALQFWMGDEEFPPRVRWLWDENAKMYLKYETMYFAVELILHRIAQEMDRLEK